MIVAYNKRRRIAPERGRTLIFFAVVCAVSSSQAYELRTTDDGTIVAYDTKSIEIRIDMSAAPETASDPDAIKASYYAWTSAGVPIDLRFKTSDNSPLDMAHDGKNIVKWEIDQWEFAPEVVATTITTYEADSGVVLDSDIVMNGVHHPWTNDPEKYEGYDVANAITHEAGHFFGLGHSPDDLEATMYPTTPVGETKKRSLEQDDLDGIVALVDAIENRTRTELSSMPETVTPDGTESEAGDDSAFADDIPNSDDASPADQDPDVAERMNVGCAVAPNKQNSGGLILFGLFALLGILRRNRLRVVAAGLVGVVLVVALVSTAQATIIRSLSVTDLVKSSDVVVRGTVTAKTPVWKGRMLYTAYTVAVDACLVGECAQNTVVLVPGGRIGNIGVRVDGVAVLRQGDQIVAFSANRFGTMRIVGMAQGVFKLHNNWAFRDLSGLQLLQQQYDPRVETARFTERLQLTDLLQTVARARLGVNNAASQSGAFKRSSTLGTLSNASNTLVKEQSGEFALPSIAATDTGMPESAGNALSAAESPLP